MTFKQHSDLDAVEIAGNKRPPNTLGCSILDRSFVVSLMVFF